MIVKHALEDHVDVGKYAGKSIRWVLLNDFAHLHWLVESKTIRLDVAAMQSYNKELARYAQNETA